MRQHNEIVRRAQAECVRVHESVHVVLMRTCMLVHTHDQHTSEYVVMDVHAAMVVHEGTVIDVYPQQHACSWCGAQWVDYKAQVTDGVSHGICVPCRDRVMGSWE